MVEDKYCLSCEMNKPMDDFHNYKLSSDGKQPVCKECKNKKYNVKSNAEHPERNDKEKAHSKAFPSPMKAIYGLFNPDGLLVYVGESKCTPYRLYCHLKANNGALKELDDITGYHYKILWDGTDKTRQDRMMVEAVLIHSLRPKFNKQWQKNDE